MTTQKTEVSSSLRIGHYLKPYYTVADYLTISSSIDATPINHHWECKKHQSIFPIRVTKDHILDCDCARQLLNTIK
jgi:hypothetical protein